MRVWLCVHLTNGNQMSEEIKDASIVVPRSIMLSIFINGATGFGMVIATLYCIGNVDDALNSPTDYPFMEILAQATGSIGGATVLAAIIAVMQISGAVGFLASASRMLWSFSQDRAVPGWKFWKQVSLCSGTLRARKARKLTGNGE